MDANIGTVCLNRFFIEDIIGQGGYGKVYKAFDLQDGSQVAIKCSYGGDETRERNITEVKILEMLNNYYSPYKGLVVNMKMNAVYDNCVVLVLEFLPQNFSKAIETNMVPDLPTISMYAKQMIEFLSFMSEVNVIHGDIKPENILHDIVGNRIKFADFGLSHCPFIGTKASLIQTLYYRAPEVLLGYNYDLPVDTWSVGCVIFECLTKKILFEAEDELEVLQQMAKIIGIPDQHVIEAAPNRDLYFTFNVENNLWELNGLNDQVTPMGLKNYLEHFLNVDVYNPQCEALINLIEGMLTLDPHERYKPESCLLHPFISNSETRTILQKENEMQEGNELGFTKNFSEKSKKEVIHLYDKIKNKEAFNGTSERIVMLSCLYIVCYNGNIVRSYNKFAKLSGIGDGDIGHLVKTVKKIMRLSKMPLNSRGRIFKECAKLGLGDVSARKAFQIFENATEKKKVQFADRNSIIATAIFIASLENGSNLSTKVIAKVMKTKESSIRKCLKRMYPQTRFYFQGEHQIYSID